MCLGHRTIKVLETGKSDLIPVHSDTRSATIFWTMPLGYDKRLRLLLCPLRNRQLEVKNFLNELKPYIIGALRAFYCYPAVW